MRVQSRDALERRSAERIARAIEMDIITRDLAPGTLIDSEAGLMERFGASRGVIREAVCLVESHMLAETRRGVGGGLIVADADPSIVTGIVSLHLARKKVSEAELLEARLPLELMALRTTIEHLDDRAVKLLEAEMDYRPERDDPLGAAAQRFHILVADLSGNGVLQMFVPMMTGLVEEMWMAPGEPKSASARRKTWAQVQRTHNKIIEAMLERDVDRASAFMTRHLDCVAKALGTRPARIRVHSS